ncbi:MAG: hypothetical protein ACREL6_04565 [Gemmatimonadales bacterium]
MLLVGGVCLLFVPDVLLSTLVPGYPLNAAWPGQLLGAAWLGVSALNWLNRSTVLGGIYGRPVVMTNLTLYFISSIVVIKAAGQTPSPAALWFAAVPAILLAVAYGWLLYRGPFEREFSEARDARG